jgi:hypothetical protein
MAILFASLLPRGPIPRGMWYAVCPASFIKEACIAAAVFSGFRNGIENKKTKYLSGE